jgi:hypothetical protein
MGLLSANRGKAIIASQEKRRRAWHCFSIFKPLMLAGAPYFVTAI